MQAIMHIHNSDFRRMFFAISYTYTYKSSYTSLPSVLIRNSHKAIRVIMKDTLAFKNSYSYKPKHMTKNVKQNKSIIGLYS